MVLGLCSFLNRLTLRGGVFNMLSKVYFYHCMCSHMHVHVLGMCCFDFPSSNISCAPPYPLYGVSRVLTNDRFPVLSGEIINGGSEK